MALAPGGGAAFTNPGNDTIKFTANSLRPAVPPAVSGGFRGTGGYAGACLGMDPRFGGGSARSSFAGSPARGLVAQAQNRIVAADRDGRVVRQLPDGTADRSFGSGGVARSPYMYTWGVELGGQPDGGLVLAGNVANEGELVQAGVVRFTADGVLDRSFGTGAVAGAAALSAGSTVKAMDVAPDGKVLISGRGIGPGTFFARFTRDGRLDPAFGSGGICHPPDQWWPASAGIEVVGGDRFYDLSSGDPNNEPAGDDIAVTRFDANCRPDPTYGQGGTTHLDGSPHATYDGRDLAVQPDGKLVVSGHSSDSTDPGINGALVARFNPEGSLDRSLAGDGVVTIPALDRGFMDSRTTVAQSIALQADGKIVIAGKEEHPDSEFQDGVLVARLLPDGRLDPSLGAGGRLRTPLEYGMSLGRAITVRPDGDIVVSAESYYQLTLIAYSGTRPPGAPVTVSGSTTPAGGPVQPAGGPVQPAAAGPSPARQTQTAQAKHSCPKAGWYRGRVRQDGIDPQAAEGRAHGHGVPGAAVPASFRPPRRRAGREPAPPRRWEAPRAAGREGPPRPACLLRTTRRVTLRRLATQRRRLPARVLVPRAEARRRQPPPGGRRTLVGALRASAGAVRAAGAPRVLAAVGLARAVRLRPGLLLLLAPGVGAVLRVGRWGRCGPHARSRCCRSPSP